MRILAALGLTAVLSATALSAKIVYRQPLDEAGQSGVCLQGDKLFLTMHAKLEGRMKGGFFFNADVVGQCFDKLTGKLLWSADLPGTWAGRVLESWHDSTSLLPVATDKHVVFHNLNGMLACFTHEGKPVWQRKWQAPNPDIKNCRMFLNGGKLLVSIPSGKIAVEENAKHPALPFYQIHSIDLVTGKDVWVSPVLLHHGTQYSLGEWKGKTIIVASMIDLSHWSHETVNYQTTFSIAVAALLLSISTTRGQDPPMNLVIIQTDEHHFGTLGCYGGEIVGTPNIDWIAEQGVLCKSFYATTPVCSPSRASFISGLYPQKTPVVTNNIPLANSVVTFAEVLRRRGYATGFAGKWHLDGAGKPQWAPDRQFGFSDNRFMFNRGH